MPRAPSDLTLELRGPLFSPASNRNNDADEHQCDGHQQLFDDGDDNAVRSQWRARDITAISAITSRRVYATQQTTQSQHPQLEDDDGRDKAHCGHYAFVLPEPLTRAGSYEIVGAYSETRTFGAFSALRGSAERAVVARPIRVAVLAGGARALRADAPGSLSAVAAASLLPPSVGSRAVDGGVALLAERLELSLRDAYGNVVPLDGACIRLKVVADTAAESATRQAAAVKRGGDDDTVEAEEVSQAASDDGEKAPCVLHVACAKTASEFESDSDENHGTMAQTRRGRAVFADVILSLTDDIGALEKAIRPVSDAGTHFMLVASVHISSGGRAEPKALVCRLHFTVFGGVAASCRRAITLLGGTVAAAVGLDQGLDDHDGGAAAAAAGNELLRAAAIARAEHDAAQRRMEMEAAALRERGSQLSTLNEDLVTRRCAIDMLITHSPRLFESAKAAVDAADGPGAELAAERTDLDEGGGSTSPQHVGSATLARLVDQRVQEMRDSRAQRVSSWLGLDSANVVNASRGASTFSTAAAWATVREKTGDGENIADGDALLEDGGAENAYEDSRGGSKQAAGDDTLVRRVSTGVALAAAATVRRQSGGGETPVVLGCVGDLGGVPDGDGATLGVALGGALGVERLRSLVVATNDVRAAHRAADEVALASVMASGSSSLVSSDGIRPCVASRIAPLALGQVRCFRGPREAAEFVQGDQTADVELGANHVQRLLIRPPNPFRDCLDDNALTQRLHDEYGFVDFAVNLIALSPRSEPLRRTLWFSLLRDTMVFTDLSSALKYRALIVGDSSDDLFDLIAEKYDSQREEQSSSRRDNDVLGNESFGNDCPALLTKAGDRVDASGVVYYNPIGGRHGARCEAPILGELPLEVGFVV